MESAGSSVRIMNGEELSNFMKLEDELNGKLMSEAGLTQLK